MPSSNRFTAYEPAQMARHRALASLNHRRLYPTIPSTEWRRDLVDEVPLLVEEGEYIESLRKLVQTRLSGLTSHEPELLAWFGTLGESGAGLQNVLFDYLAEAATFDELRWFLGQDISGSVGFAGFEDLVALTQVRMPPRARRELGRNYWYELGRGKEGAMHGPMLTKLCTELGIAGTHEVTWESLAHSNLHIALAHHRRYAFQSLGALGVIAQMAPGRAAKLDQGLSRLGIGAEARQYFTLSAHVDTRRSRDWNREIIAPLVAETPALAIAIAEGALMSLEAGARCFKRYRRHLGLESRAA